MVVVGKNFYRQNLYIQVWQTDNCGRTHFNRNTQAINRLISTNARMIPMLTLIATSLCNTLASIDIPCSVNTYGNVRLPP